MNTNPNTRKQRRQARRDTRTQQRIAFAIRDAICTDWDAIALALIEVPR